MDPFCLLFIGNVQITLVVVQILEKSREGSSTDDSSQESIDESFRHSGA